jgi:hypothetical protein
MVQQWVEWRCCCPLLRQQAPLVGRYPPRGALPSPFPYLVRFAVYFWVPRGALWPHGWTAFPVAERAGSCVPAVPMSDIAHQPSEVFAGG